MAIRGAHVPVCQGLARGCAPGGLRVVPPAAGNMAAAVPCNANRPGQYRASWGRALPKRNGNGALLHGPVRLPQNSVTTRLSIVLGYPLDCVPIVMCA